MQHPTSIAEPYYQRSIHNHRPDEIFQSIHSKYLVRILGQHKLPGTEYNGYVVNGHLSETRKCEHISNKIKCEIDLHHTKKIFSDKM